MDVALLLGVTFAVVFICGTAFVLLIGERRQDLSPKEQIVVTEDDPPGQPPPPAKPPS